MSQFLDPNNQQLAAAARFNAQHAASLAASTGHLVSEQFGVNDPNRQFVTVVQHQHQHHHHQQQPQQQQHQQQQQQQQHQQQQHSAATQQIHNVAANNFNFFQQHQGLSVVGAPVTPSVHIGPAHRQHAHMDQITSHHIDHHQTAGNQHHLDHQQLTCVNAMSADNISHHIADGGSFIFDQTNGVFRIPHASVLDASNAIVVNTNANNLRQQQQQHQLQQNHQQHSGHHSSAEGSQAGVNGNRGQGRGSRSDENGHKRSDPTQTAGADVGGRGLNESSIATNHTSGKSSDGVKSNTKGSRSKSANKKVEKPDPNRRTFACPTCGKGFTEKFNMKRHMQIHSQTRPKFVCNLCSKSFAWKDNFVRHKKAAHGNILDSFSI